MGMAEQRTMPWTRTPIAIAAVGADTAVLDHIVTVLENGGLPVVAHASVPQDLSPPQDGPAVTAIVMSTAPRRSASRSALRALHTAAPSARLILVTPAMRGQTVRDSLAAGADAIVFEEEVGVALLLAVRAVHAGQVMLSRSVRDEVEPAVLTFREKQVLGMVVIGLTNYEIASKLYLAESTVKSHLSSVFSKLGVCSRHEAAARILDPRGGLSLGELGVPSDRVVDVVA
jgi:DNA-binding NarL/FixJ family response regulator